MLLWLSALLALAPWSTTSAGLSSWWITFLAMAKFYAHELVLGQDNLLFAVVVMIAVVQLRRGRDVMAGRPARPCRRRQARTRRCSRRGSRSGRGKRHLPRCRRTVVTAAGTGSAQYGWAANLHLLGDWWTTVRTSTAPNLLNQDNVSLAGMFTKWMGPDSAAPTLTLLAIALLVGLTGIVIAARAGLPAPEPLEAALLLTLIPLISPQGWDYVFLIATPAVMLIIDRLSLLPRGLRIATIGAIAVVALSIYDVMGREAYAAFMASSAITLCFLVEIAALITLRFRRAA